jgi:uncharacterized damage-inducible protein DinB
MRKGIVCIACCVVAVGAGAQPPASAPAKGSLISRLVQGAWAGAKRDIVESADQMPEANYTFKPVESVRTFGQIIAHVAGTNYLFCSAAKEEKSPFAEDYFEKNATTKTAIVKALKDSVAYCDATYAALTEASAAEMVKAPFGSNQVPRVAPLFSNVGHNVEHYGNLVTYFRIKGMVPPSTKREGGQ